MDDQSNICCVCERASLVRVPMFESLHRVTSDVRPWDKGGALAVCGQCGTVQKPRTAKWHEEVARTYESYDLYYQSGGEDHPVFDQASGKAAGRSTRLIERLVVEVGLEEIGRVLDVGCGKGGFLHAFGSIAPGWRLEGFDLEDAPNQSVDSISGIAAYHSGSIDAIPGEFNLVVLNHVLEHIPEPSTFLAEIGGKMTATGKLLIQVPDVDQNPFDLVVVDHCIHFGTASLRLLLTRAGFSVEVLTDDWLPNELTLVATQTSGDEAPGQWDDDIDAALRAERTTGTVSWLLDTAADALGRSRDGAGFGIFGTSIAAVWLDAQTDGAAGYFCDEDAARHGRTLMGRPIVDPRSIEPPKTVYMPLAPKIAQAIAARLDGSGLDLVLPLPAPSTPNG